MAPLLAELVPRLRVEREVVWADGRGLDARRLAWELVERLEALGVAARAGVAAVPVTAELAARWGPRSGWSPEGPTPFLVKERTGWGWRRMLKPASTGSPAVSGASPSRGRSSSSSSTEVEAAASSSPGSCPSDPPPSGCGGKGGAAAGSARTVGEGRVVVVPAGEERPWMAELPVVALVPESRLQTLLEGVGVQTVGAFATLEREAVEVRLGGGAAALWRLARGDDRRLLFDRVPPDRPHGSLDFVDYVLTDPSRLLFTANALLGPLCDGLTGRGEHARTLRLVLPLANGDRWERTIRPARPTASRETWRRLIRGLLDRLSVPDAVAGMRLEVGATEEAAVRQGDLFDRGFATAAAVEAAVARLAERQLHPLAPVPTAHPLVERRGKWKELGVGVGVGVGPLLGGENGSHAPSSGTGSGWEHGLGLQLLEEPRRVRVETVGRRDHAAPVRIRDGRGWREVVLAAGPDRISGGQWEAESYAREYYRCVTEEGVPLWVYRDALDDVWYLHGWWD